MEKKLIPYSVHLPEEIYIQVKAAAGARRASELIRDAIVTALESEDKHTAAYNRAVREAISIVQRHPVAKTISVGGETIADALVASLRSMIIRREPHGDKKKA